MNSISKVDIPYDGKIYTKKQIRIAYGVTIRIWKKMLNDIKEIFDSGKRHTLYPKEIRELIKEYGNPDWTRIPENKSLS